MSIKSVTMNCLQIIIRLSFSRSAENLGQTKKTCTASSMTNAQCVQNGSRKTMIKVFRNEPPDNILEEVDDTSGLLNDLLLEEKLAVEAGTSAANRTQ